LPWRLLVLALVLVLGIICLPKLASLSGLVAPRASLALHARLGLSSSDAPKELPGALCGTPDVTESLPRASLLPA